MTTNANTVVRCPIDNPDLYDLLQQHPDDYKWLRKSQEAPLRSALMEGCEGLRFLECRGEKSWLRARRCFITASEAADMANEGYGTPYKIYLAKVHGVESETSEAMAERYRHGHRMEWIMDQEIQMQWGPDAAIENPGDFVLVINQKYPRLCATLDRIIQFYESYKGIPVGIWPVDYKSKQYGNWNDGVDKATLTQLCSQAEVCGTKGAAAAGHIGGQYCYDFVVNQMGPLVGASASHFWREYIDTLTPPVRQTAEDWKQFQLLHPDDSGETVEIDPVTLQEAHERLQEAKDMCKHAEEAKEAAQAHLLSLFDRGPVEPPATFITDGSGLSYSWKTQSRKPVITVPVDLEEKLKQAGVAYKLTPESKYRVLRASQKK